MIDVFPQSRVPKLRDAELCRYIEHYAELRVTKSSNRFAQSQETLRSGVVQQLPLLGAGP
jgi:hypothetical protein